MDLITLLTAAFDVHRNQIAALERKLAAQYQSVRSEITIELDRDWKHAKYYTVDFLIEKKDGGFHVIELSPENFVSHPLLKYTHGGVELTFKELVWDRVRFSIGGEVLEASSLDHALGRWHWDWSAGDLPTSRGIIHAVTISSKGLGIDFGSAPPEAFLDVVTALGEAGLTKATIVRDE